MVQRITIQLHTITSEVHTFLINSVLP